MAEPEISVARPWIGFGPLDYSRTDGILVDIPEQTEQVAVSIHDERLEAALEQVANPVPSPVEPLRVRGLQDLHDLREPYVALLDRQMNVVRHEAVGPKRKAKAIPIPTQTVEILLPILVTAEDRPPLVTPSDDVVNRPATLKPQRPRDPRTSRWMRIYLQIVASTGIAEEWRK